MYDSHSRDSIGLCSIMVVVFASLLVGCLFLAPSWSAVTEGMSSIGE